MHRPADPTRCRRLLLVLGIALGTVLAGAGPATALDVVAADPGGLRAGVTFSPDGDGVADELAIVAAGAPGERVRLVVEVARGLGATSVIARTRPVAIGRSGRARLVWDGHGGGRLLSDGPYVARVCTSAGACAADRVAVHLRVLAAAIATQRSFAPGENVPLLIQGDQQRVAVGLAPDDARPGTPPTEAVTLAPGRRRYALPRDIAPGLYRLVVTDGTRVGWRGLPLLVRAPALAAPPPGVTLVVLPALTWAVYNEYDADRDGRPDSHYETPGSAVTRLGVPYETAGLPAPGSAGREQDAGHTDGFMRTWRLLGGANALPATFVTDLQLARLPAAVLRRYAALLFLGHGEYYTRAEFERIRAYQTGGGDFLYGSANGFYALTEVRGDAVRLLVRPQRTPSLNDALITAVQYTGCCWSVGSPGPLLVTAAGLRAAPWAFRGTGLRAGDVLAYAGGEIDGFGPQTPPGLTVLAELDWRAPDRPIQSGAMVLARRAGGGRVFAPGTMGFIDGTARNARLRRVFGNVWSRFAAE